MLCHLVAWIEQSIPDELLVNPDVRPDPTNQYLNIKVYDYYTLPFKMFGMGQKCGHVWFDQNFDPSLLTNKP